MFRPSQLSTPSWSARCARPVLLKADPALQRPVQQLEETFAVEIDADLGIRRAACHTVEVADGLPTGEIALALDVDPHRARLQQAGFEYRRDGDGIVQRRGVEAEDALVGGGEIVQEPGHYASHPTCGPQPLPFARTGAGLVCYVEARHRYGQS